METKNTRKAEHLLQYNAGLKQTLRYLVLNRYKKDTVIVIGVRHL